nr:protein ENHANCED DOWNY MILDEW 2 isoform X1 [Ipomoea batatas]GME06296.1 protein ENHANCED DOWNY MILDEW 2 isoform X1 [Ipomoea batatas]GME13968.1 protein ENHANCED DOWNY MILDEW 2 isoform X1 [Ipomoea batatas]
MKVYEKVTAWKFDLSSIKPDIWVLHKQNSWILLLKPRKAFEDTIIRTILVNDKTLSEFIVDDLGDETFEDGSDEYEDDQFESVCAISDNGGEMIW